MAVATGSEAGPQAAPPLGRRSKPGRRWTATESFRGNVLLGLSLLALLAVWHVWAAATSPLVLPAPGDVLSRLITYVGEGRATPHIVVTVKEILSGFVVGTAVGVVLGTLAAEFALARRLIMPYVIITQALPKFALAPILVIWLGFGMAPKIVIAALIAFFPVLENTYLGLSSTPRTMMELFSALRASRWTTLIRCRVPHALPALFSGLRVALMLSLVGAVVAEYVGANKGLGALIIVAQGTLDTELMFVSFVLLTLLGLLLDSLHSLVQMIVMRRVYGRAAKATGPTEGRVSV